jgi:hypothetical protein
MTWQTLIVEEVKYPAFGGMTSFRSNFKPQFAVNRIPTYPGLAKGQLAIERSILTHENGDSRKPRYERTFDALPIGTTDSQALALVKVCNDQPSKPGNIVHLLVRGTGGDYAEQVGGYGACSPYRQAA